MERKKHRSEKGGIKIGKGDTRWEADRGGEAVMRGKSLVLLGVGGEPRVWKVSIKIRVRAEKLKEDYYRR